MTDEYIIKTMSRRELDTAIEWAAKEGWNPGLYDAESFHIANPNGFLIGLLNGEPIAIISVIKYSDTFGFLGFYIVKKEYRGKGYGIQIWNAGIDYLNGCNIGLDGVIDQQKNYQKSGFKLAYSNIRYQGISGEEFPKDNHFVNLSSIPFKTINDYDQDFFPTDREQFLKSWITQSKSQFLGILENGEFSGYGVIRPCYDGYKIGPLFANTPKLADTLFMGLKASVKAKKSIYLDIPEINKNAIALVKKYDMNKVFETARMYTKKSPNLSIDKLYGVTTFELG